MACSGCGVHYRNGKTGDEHIWGLGQLQLKEESVNGHTIVKTRSKVPGVALGLGDGGVSLMVGYHDSQRIRIVPQSEANELEPPIATSALVISESEEGSALWGIGHLKMKSTPTTGRHTAILTGDALAGFRASLSRRPALTAGLKSYQVTSIHHEDILIEYTDRTKDWPGVNFPKAKVKVIPAENLSQSNEQ